MKKILLLFFVCIASIFNSYSQDTCITATAITAGSFVVTAVNGTEIPSPICADNGAGAATGEWYVFTATVDGVANVTTDLPANTGGDQEFMFIQVLVGV